jgi:hypothetical protein
MTEENASCEEMMWFLACEFFQLVQLLLSDLLAAELVYQFVVVYFFPSGVYDIIWVHD